MAIEKIETVDQITVTKSGVVLVRTAKRLVEDGQVLSEIYHRTSLTPGQDVSEQPVNVQAICAAAWTPDVIDSFKTLMLQDAQVTPT